MFSKLSIEDIDVTGKTVFIRADFNVPLDKEGRITDDRKIVETIPTINHCIERNAKVILASHLGRPKGKVIDSLRLKPVAERLEKLLDRKIIYLDDCIGEKVEKTVKECKSKDIVLLENVRFYKEETENDPEFSKKLASLADIFVNEAFGSSHRAHSSIEGIAYYLKPAVAGLSLKKEIEFFGGLLSKIEKPFVGIIGGAKVSTKLNMIKNFLSNIDTILIGGGMAYTFLAALDRPIGDSLFEPDQFEIAKQTIKDAEQKKVEIVLPVDHVVANSVSEDAEVRYVSPDEEIPDGWKALDIGKETVKIFVEKINSAKTVFWNGPLGMFEIKKFSKGTEAIARAIADCKAVTLAGGGDTDVVIDELGIFDRLTHVSTAGGALLEFLEGRKLPGIEVLTNKN